MVSSKIEDAIFFFEEKIGMAPQTESTHFTRATMD